LSTVALWGRSDKIGYMSEKQQKQIFCWYGENDFALHEQLKQWRSLFEQKFTALNIVNIDKATMNAKELIQEIKNSLQVNSLFGSEKLIILRNFLQKEKKDEVTELLIDLLDKVSGPFFVIFIQTEKPDQRGALFAKLKKLEKSGKAEIKEYGLPKGFELKKIVKQMIEKKQGQFDEAAIDLIIALTGSDLWQINHDIDKLVHYKKGKTIVKDDVKFLVKGKYNDDIFALMDAIGTGQKSRALQLFRDQIDGGANEMYLFSMFTRQIRLLLIAHDIVTQENVRDRNFLAKKMKVHPFVAQKLLGQVQRFDRAKLISLYGSLLQIDVGMKMSNIDVRVLFDTLIVSM